MVEPQVKVITNLNLITVGLASRTLVDMYADMLDCSFEKAAEMIKLNPAELTTTEASLLVSRLTAAIEVVKDLEHAGRVGVEVDTDE